jgi:[ribosomal protein S5]-alanine N-acetyltransferase
MPLIQTERMLLRQLDEGDAAFILQLLNEAAFLKFIGDKGVRNLEDARAYIREGPQQSYQQHGFGLYAACLRDATPIGICGLLKRAGLDDVDVGFAFLERYRRQGYAVEAAAAALAYGRQTLNLRRVVAITSKDNVGSIAVLKRIGLVFERMITMSPDREELKLFALSWPMRRT